MRTLVTDLRYGLRVLWRAPSFTLSVVGVLAVAIGANVAVFSIVDAVLLRPLPYERAGDLVRLFHVPPQSAFPGMTRFSVSPANFYDWQREAQSFDAMAIYRSRSFTLTGAGDADTVAAGAVGRNFFEIVGTRPAVGRTFTSDEDEPGRAHVVIVSHGFWTSRLGAARDAIGRTLTLDDETYTIVGIMPAAFSITAWGAAAANLWVPLAYTDAQRLVRDNHNAAVVARLKHGVSVTQAQAEMSGISRRLEQAYPKENTGWGATVIPLQELIVGDIRASLLTLLAAVGLVLLIACANVGNLLFTRAAGRRKEFALRSALGAGRGRIIQHLLVESMVLSAIGGLAGLLLARGSLAAAVALLAREIPRVDEIALDWRVVLFVASASMFAAVVAGAIPALRVSGAQLTETLKEGGRSDAAVGTRTRRGLIVCEVALSLVLLMGAAVMLRTVAALRHVDAGFDPRNLLTLQVTLPEARYRTVELKRAFLDSALERLGVVPGVVTAAAIDDLPTQGGSVQPIVIEGTAELLPRDQPTTEVRQITPGYLRTMSIPLLRGRDVAPADVNVVLVSQSAARLLWGNTDPIGRHATLPLESRTVVHEVVGIVGDVVQMELSKGPNPTVYKYSRQQDFNGMTLVARTTVPPMSIARAATAALHEVDAAQPVNNVRTMTAVLDESLTAQRFSAMLLGVFAAVALVLSSVGIYSVLSYIVGGRRQEIGIRTALGATTADVLRSVIIEGMTPALVGIVVGILAAIASARLLSTMVWGISASDPVTLVTIAIGLALISLLASLVPAYRASCVDPVQVLRGTSSVR